MIFLAKVYEKKNTGSRIYLPPFILTEDVPRKSIKRIDTTREIPIKKKAWMKSTDFDEI